MIAATIVSNPTITCFSSMVLDTAVHPLAQDVLPIDRAAPDSPRGGAPTYRLDGPARRCNWRE